MSIAARKASALTGAAALFFIAAIALVVIALDYAMATPGTAGYIERAAFDGDRWLRLALLCVTMSIVVTGTILWRISWSAVKRNEAAAAQPAAVDLSPTAVRRAWMPWLFLSAAVTLWGLLPAKAFLNGGFDGLAAYRAGQPARVSPILQPSWAVPGLDRLVFRDFPVEPVAVDRARLDEAAYRGTRAEAARFTLNWASATGTAILVAAIATTLYLRIPFAQFLSVALATLVRMRTALLTIM